MLAIIWRYEVKRECIPDFERIYAPDGDWALLFSKADGFLGVQLFKGADGIYATIDQWRSEAAFDAFMSRYRADYEALDRSTEGWTTAEQLIGRFSPCLGVHAGR